MTKATSRRNEAFCKNPHYAQTPLNIYWELTRACALACRHCRASAMPQPHPDQLTFAEGVRFIHQIRGFGDPPPQLILTGGDPLAHPDLFRLIEEARRTGIHVSITPAVTPRLTQDVLAELHARGVEGIGLSLDGSHAGLHDSIRGIPGTFDRTLEAARWVGALGMPLQINTLVTAETAPDLPSTYALLRTFPVAR